ncbi:MAG: tRNA (adenosine(37)-N6)-dimethylallyltransferase MiaA [Pseudomonadota bacterium]
MNWLSRIPGDIPVLIAGPTASGKSALALALAERDRRVVINADALQVFANWRVLTARPAPEDEARAPHALYGHVAADATYSVGRWLRDLAPWLDGGSAPVIVGGTGLYFMALTEGLAEVPPVSPETRRAAMSRLQEDGLSALVDALDPPTRARIDTQNPARVLRAFEVLESTGRGLADWQDATPAPLLPLERVHPVLVDAPRPWLTPRIEARFDQMLAGGVLDEVRANLTGWCPDHQSAKAIGAPELVAHLQGETDLATARAAVIVATRQYAKRQRSWFRARMGAWQHVPGPELGPD